MTEPILLNKTNPLLPAEDFQALRRQGIGLIEKLGSDLWTEYNPSDPGITILEAVCYAITDLAYRAGFEMKDLLAPKALDGDTWDKVFYTARQILHNAPLTLNDYRKIIVDVEGVRNAWIEISKDYEVPVYVDYTYPDSNQKDIVQLAKHPCPPQNDCGGILTLKSDGERDFLDGQDMVSSDLDHETKIVELNGLYNVILELEESLAGEREREEVRTKVIQRLNRNRNLCEDFLSVTNADYEDFTLDGAFVLAEDADPDETLARIFFTVYQYFMPGIRFYTINQLMEKGLAVDEIFEGPPLRHGFLLDEDLEKTDLFRDMRLSDLINAIADIPGIKAITYLHLPAPEGDVAYFNVWIKELKAQRKIARLDAAKSSAVFCKQREIITYNKGKEQDRNMTHLLRRYRDWQAQERRYKLKGHDMDFPVPVGEFMDLEDYFPVQYSLPRCYGVGEFEQLRSAPDTLPEIQMMQLRGYLLFFEQILVNYHSQLAHLRELFSFDESSDRTWFTKTLYQINDLSELLLVNDGLFAKLETWRLLVRQIEDENIRLLSWQTELANTPDTPENKTRREWLEEKIAEGEALLDELNEQKQQLAPAAALEDQIRKNTEDFAGVLQGLAEKPAQFRRKRNQMLDHLLGRFAESVSEYEAMSRLVCPQGAQRRHIGDKIRLLQDYPNVSNRRSKAFDYTLEKEIWDTPNVSGAERRIGRLLGFGQIERRTLAPDFVHAHPVVERKPDGTFVHKKNSKGKGLYVVKLVDPDDHESVLLTSREVAGECCAEELMSLLLERAGERRNFRFKEEKRKRGRHEHGHKGEYWLELTGTDEESRLASSERFGSEKERETAYDRIAEVIGCVHQNEGLHLVEHILLRPKLDEVIPVYDQNNNKNPDDDPAQTVSLLNICLDECDRPPGDKKDKHPYRFYLSRLPAQLCYNDEPWVLRLQKSDASTPPNWTNLLFQRHDPDQAAPPDYLSFNRYDRMTERLALLRQFGGVEDNYLIFRNEDGKWGFQIVEGQGGKVLAQSKFGYTKAQVLGERDALVKFFSFQFDLYGCPEVCDHAEDPYSFRVSVVLPCWVKRFRDKSYRNLVEKTIRRELPAHVHPRIYWLGVNEMRRFEQAFSGWLVEISNHFAPDYEPVNQLVDVLDTLQECGCCKEDCKN